MSEAAGPVPQAEQIAPRIWLFSSPGFRVNTGLVVGDRQALLIDTGSGPRQAEALLGAVRTVTDLPLTVVNTHAHFDHFFGNEFFATEGGAEDFWATAEAAAAIAATGAEQRRHVAEVEPEMAVDAGPATGIRVPTRLVEDTPVDLDLGGITATLFHLGRGHTGHDLLVGAGDVLFTGDLVEEGADPAFEDSFPKEWIRTLGKMVALEDLYTVFVPGHGAPVGLDFVTTQMNKMRTAVTVTRSAMDQASTDVTKAVPILPYGPVQSRALLNRLRTLAQWKWLRT